MANFNLESLMYPKIRQFLLSIFCLLAALISHAHTDTSPLEYNLNPSDTILHFSQKFIINSNEMPSFDPLDDFFHHIQSIEDCDTTVHILVIGHASIDGKDELNMRLSQQRAFAVRDTIVKYFQVDPAKISCNCTGEDWELLRKLVLDDNAVPARSRVLSAIEADWTTEEKESKIRGYAEGKTWEYLNENIFPQMRSASVAWVLSKRVLATPTVVEYVPEPEPEPAFEPVVVEAMEEVAPESPAVTLTPDDWRHKFYIKSNVLGWGALMVNGALEIDLAKHWSFSVAGYWAGWNYFKETVKFRNGTVMPEFRYWPKADNTGLFVNVHGAVSWFNVALDGKYRYQVKDNDHPALGGGVGVGWRFFFCRNHRWMMEAALGGGCYRVEYDRFINRPMGNRVDSKKKTLFCLDQIALSFVYAIPL